MLQEYPTTRCSRKCHFSGRPIQAGESYVSALVPMGGDLVRIDVAADQWKSAPQGTVGWWKCRMPYQSSAKLCPAPVGVLQDSLSELLRNPNKTELAYLLALILVRRRVPVETDSLEFQEREQPSETLWLLVSQSDGRQWEVPMALPISKEESEKLRGELLDLLFTEE